MFHRILVLLDGSPRAELALPVATRLARASNASLILLRMMTLPADYVWYELEPPFLAREILTTEMLQASTYLKGKAWEMEMAGIPVRTHTLAGPLLQRLQTFIAEQCIDLVVLCSHGQIPFRPRTRSSMAWHMLQQSVVPVLVLRETFGQEGTLDFRDAHPVRVVVPLDGSLDAEAALAPAAFLAAALSAPERGILHLVSVLPSCEIQKDGEVLKQLEQRAWNNLWAYLQATGQALQKGETGQLKLLITTSVLIHPDVAEAIIHAAEMQPQAEEPAGTATAGDLIALTTHGRSGLHHLRRGNTAERVLQRTHLPFLMVPPTVN